MARALAAATDARFRRVQFTPDLLPSDIVGTSIYRADRGSFEFREGPIFTDTLLADEINRAPAKTQAALLEAMEERQVTADGTRMPLGDRFLVIATQNPVEFEGTYPLPEAQLDRFFLKLEVPDPRRRGRGGAAPPRRPAASARSTSAPPGCAAWSAPSSLPPPRADVGAVRVDRWHHLVHHPARARRPATSPDLLLGAARAAPSPCSAGPRRWRRCRPRLRRPRGRQGPLRAGAAPPAGAPPRGRARRGRPRWPRWSARSPGCRCRDDPAGGGAAARPAAAAGGLGARFGRRCAGSRRRCSSPPSPRSSSTAGGRRRGRDCAVRRELDDPLSVGRANPVRVRIDVEGGGRHRALVRDEHPPEMRASVEVSRHA